MPLYRVRVELEDSPGRLARLASSLGSVGANILSIDVQGLYGASVADEIVLHAPVEVNLSGITNAVERSGALVLSAEPVDHHAAGDVQVRCYDAARYVLEANRNNGEYSLQEALIKVVRADLVSLIAEENATRGLAQVALREQQTVTGPERDYLGSSSTWIEGEPSWAMAAPFERGSKRWVAVMVRGSPDFTSTEAARVRAFLRFISVVEDATLSLDVS
ncbi:MAG: hypothetical protein ACSLFB_05135 [Acidimicrobiales bacterium]